MKDIPCIGRDHEAQLHVLEAVVAAMLFFGALQVAVSLTPDAQTTTALDTLAITGRDALLTLYLMPSPAGNASDNASSALIHSLVSGEHTILTDFLDSILDHSVSYSLRYVTYPGGNVTEILTMTRTGEEMVSTHLPVHHGGTVYDVQLFLWREPRRVVP